MPAQSKAGRWKKKADQRARACEIVERSQKFWPLDKRPGDDGDDGDDGNGGGGEGGGTGRTGQRLLATEAHTSAVRIGGPANSAEDMDDEYE
ncbi:hypothetical protein E4U15_000478 [Claviceps sp. LM218 group G6]|nr:hypothetical protein E4U15_000478 [Claviceps sp. LM218 group G6]